MISYLFGASESAPLDLPVTKGHRGVAVLIDGVKVYVDLDILAAASGLFLQVERTSTQELPLEDFPGGIAIFRQIVHQVLSFDQPTLQPDDGNVLNLFEAAWLLECPRIFEDVAGSPYMRALSSRRKFELLEHLLPFTTVSEPAGSTLAAQDASNARASAACADEEFLTMFRLETAMWQQTENAALSILKQLDNSDFVLGPQFASGSVRVSVEVIRHYEQRLREVGMLSSTFRPIGTMWKNLTDKPLNAKTSWDVHTFALECLRRKLPVPAGAPSPSATDGQDDEGAQADIPNAVYELIDDRRLLRIADLIRYVDIQRAPPNWKAVIVRTLLASGPEDGARQAFAEAFPHSHRVKLLAWQWPAKVPASWLSDVARYPEACVVLLHVIANYREMDPEEFCDIVEHVLLATFVRTPRCADVVLASEVMNDIVGDCFDAARKVAPPWPASASDGSAGGGSSGLLPGMPGARCPSHWEGQHLVLRLQRLASRLFNVAFVAQQGFLPHEQPGNADSRPHGAGGPAAEDRRPDARADYICNLEPRVTAVTGDCLWDKGLLQIDFLRPLMDAGRVSDPDGKILHYGRQVIMRHLWYNCKGTYCKIEYLRDLWELALWPLCDDTGLIREALEYLKGTARGLQAENMSWCEQHQEELFKMFTALDLSRVPSQALLSPWVPPQVLVVRLLVQQQPAEQFHSELHGEVLSSMESLKSIRGDCDKLAEKMDTIDHRTIICKSHISNTIAAIEEHQRNKRRSAQPPRLMLPVMPK